MYDEIEQYKKYLSLKLLSKKCNYYSLFNNM